jgi:hypothetical protein
MTLDNVHSKYTRKLSFAGALRNGDKLIENVFAGALGKGDALIEIRK